MIKKYNLYACEICGESFNEWEDSDAKKQAEEHEKIPFNPIRLQNNGVYRWTGENPNSGKFIGIVQYPTGIHHVMGGPKYSLPYEDQHSMDYWVVRFYTDKKGEDNYGKVDDWNTTVTMLGNSQELKLGGKRLCRDMRN